MPMKKILSIFAVAVLSLFAGEAFAQRNLPGMSAVEVCADMVNGFYTGNSRNCGYNLGVFYSIIKGNNANTWSIFLSCSLCSSPLNCMLFIINIGYKMSSFMI